MKVNEISTNNSAPIRVYGSFTVHLRLATWVLDSMQVTKSVDLETKLSSRNVSQKMNGQICFSNLTTWKYLKLEFRFQVSSISESSG